MSMCPSERSSAVTVALLCAAFAVGAGPVGAQEQESSDTRPAPRWPDGRMSFTGPPSEIGNWEGSSARGAELLFVTEAEATNTDSHAFRTNLYVDDVPFQPWARALFEHRQERLIIDEPYARCQPSGGARPFQTPYGLEILDLPDAGQIIIAGVGGPHSWRVIHMDGRSHPEDPEPSRFGHSIGWWEGDTLVIDTVGFSENFWINRLGVPHTQQLRTVERIWRPSFETLKYELTIEDLGAYTEPWSGGWRLYWVSGNEPFDFLCQENNYLAPVDGSDDY